MNYYDNIEDYRARGIDSDLDCCLTYNPQEGFAVEDVEKVLAVWEGENDGDDWRWVLKLRDGRFVFLQGGCDYTGWDCQSWASHAFAENPEEACQKALGKVPVDEEHHPYNAGLGHMISGLFGNYNENNPAVCDALLNQVQLGKDKTWSEGKDEEFGLT